ncbi:hypothetical protein [Pseudomonas shirazensis]|uniref:hypothetical protein n=1 Tax=Pseudomonas shirazensis TaxID=2745494 RepID=UPI003D2DBF4F
MRYEFNEVLNDQIDYFLLGDIQLLARFKEENGLPDDLAHEFTHSDSGDRAVLEGVVLPLAGIENLPYTVIFSLDEVSAALLQPASQLKHRRKGYWLRVENRAVMLFTWRILQHFTNKTMGDLLARYQMRNRPIIELENGWYQVEVLAGAVLRDGLYEPTFEFIFESAARRIERAPVDTAYAFTLRADIA